MAYLLAEGQVYTTCCGSTHKNPTFWLCLPVPREPAIRISRVLWQEWGYIMNLSVPKLREIYARDTEATRTTYGIPFQAVFSQLKVSFPLTYYS